MIKDEWKSLLSNKFMMVVVIAIMIIPTIYTTIFLGSMWDPYGNIDKLPVAIVNNDKSVVYENKTMDVGSELVNNLKENNSLDFNFVDKDVAKNGLENGTYYMVVTIPENFSENATTLMDEAPKKMELEYEINPGTNYIASKMGQTAVTKIRNNIQEKITKQYAEIIFDNIHNLGAGLTDAANGTDDIIDGVDKLKNGNKEISSNLQKLASSSLTFKEGATELQLGLGKYTDGVEAAKNGAAELQSGVHRYTNATDTVKDGVRELQSGILKYTDGVQKVNDGSKQFTTAIGNFNKVLPEFSKGISQISSKSGDLRNGVNSISSANTQVINSMNAISESIGSIVDKDSDTQKNISELKNANIQLNNAIQSLNKKIKNSNSSDITNSLENIGTNAENAGEVYKKTISQIKESSAFSKLSDSEKAEILKILQENGDDLNNNLTEIGDNTNNVASKFSSSMSEIDNGVNSLVDSSNMVLSSNMNTINKLSDGLISVKSTLDGNQQNMGIIQAMNQINNQFNNLSSSINLYTESIEQVNNKSSNIPLGINQLFLGVNKIDNALSKLSENNAELNGGVAKLYTGLNQLTSNNSQLNEGTDRLYNGLNTLTSNNGTLLSGVSKLSEGAQKISDGSDKLADGSMVLGEGLNDLYDGTVVLDKGLKDGADEVNSTKTSNDTYEMVANPVQTCENFMTNVDNNGNAMAPYMMCVGLWVACIAFCIMYPLTSYSGEMENGFKWWLSKASVLLFVTVVQAIVMVFMLKSINGLNPARLYQTILIACISSATFMAIMYFFNILMGKVGSFLMLIFMVLQLGGCAGTYPVELASPIYSFIKPLMPFTYCVHAFRAAICDGVSITNDILVCLSILLGFVLMTIVVFHFKAKKEMNEQDDLKDSLISA